MILLRFVSESFTCGKIIIYLYKPLINEKAMENDRLVVYHPVVFMTESINNEKP